jgi:hypothetical protein
MYWFSRETPLVVGEYVGGRLLVTESSLEYIVGQYEPTEIWWALEDYFIKVGRKNE